MQIVNKILYFFKPFQIWIQRLGYQETEFTVEEIKELLLKIKPGDILGSYESGRFTSMFIKGNFDHVAIVDENLYVVEAVGDKFVNGKNVGGVRKIPLEKWLWTKNHIFVMRHKVGLTAFFASIKSAEFIGYGYDYAFAKGNEKFYCSELVYLCFKPFDPSFLDLVPEDKQILPIDYLKDPNLELIYNSRTNI